MISMKYVISAAAILLVNVGVFALPQGGRIEQGAGNLDNPAHIIQESQHLQTRWNSFDIGATEQVRIQQPNAQASINIKVRNGAATNINGTLTANGRVSLENPAGIQFGANSVVNVGGLLVSSSNGAVTGLGEVSAAEVVRFQGLSSKNIVNVGGAVSAQEIIVESNGDIVIGNSAHFTASKQILIGGGYQGKDSNVLNARTNDVKASAQINAPYVIVWSDKVTRFLGRIDAGRGFVEVSGKEHLIFPDISRAKAGDLLLDPVDITIVAETGANEDNQIIGDGILRANERPTAQIGLRASAIANYVGNVILAATGTITVNEAITKSNGSLTLAANNFVINRVITISGTDGSGVGHYLSFELTGGVPALTPFGFGGFGRVGEFIADDIRIANNYTGGQQIGIPALFAVPGRSISITTAANGGVDIPHGFNLCETNGTGCGDLTISAGTLTLGGTFALGTTELIVTAGAIVFNSGTDITASSIELTQGGAYAGPAPATFNTPPTLNSPNSFIGSSWGVCGDNCTGILAPANLDITDGNLETALTDKFTVLGGTLDLGTFDLMASGMPLTIPSTILTITTTGTISITDGLTTTQALTLNAGTIGITGGLTASAALTLTADTITFGGAFNFGTNALTLNFATSLGGGTTAPTLTVDSITVTHTGSGPVALPEWLFTGQNVTLYVAEISIPTATTWDVVGLGFEVNTTITGEALTLTGSASFIGAIGPDLTIDVASLSIGSNTLLLAENLNVTSRAAGTDNSFNLTLTATNNLTVAGHINAGTGILALTATNGEIIFTNNPTITADSITLTQADEFPRAKPANFGSVTPSIAGVVGSPQRTVPWATGGLPILAGDIIVDAGGDLADAIVNYFVISGTTLNLDTFNLTVSGGSLTIPAGITSITTTGTISITGGLTASAALSLSAGTISITGGVMTTAALDVTAGTALTVGGTWTLVGNSSLVVSTSPSVGDALVFNSGSDILTLTVGAGAIAFNSGTNITAGSIVLTQGDSYATTAPAVFSTPPTLNSTTSFTKPISWGVCGPLNCGIAPVDLTITDGNLEAALSKFKFAIPSDGVLDLGNKNLTASGIPLVIPATITSITTTGTISITSGLTASAALSLKAGTELTHTALHRTALTHTALTRTALTVSGTWDLGGNALTLTSANAITVASARALTISSTLTMVANNFFFYNIITISGTGNYLSLFLTGKAASPPSLPPSSAPASPPFVFGRIGGFIADDVRVNNSYTGNQLELEIPALFAAAGRSVTITVPAGGGVNFGNGFNFGKGFNLCEADGTGCGNLTVSAAAVSLSGTFAADNITLTATRGDITFNSGTDITANSITLTQVGAYAVTAPATFSTPPTLNRSTTRFTALSWGVCGNNCLVPVAAHLTITDGNLEAALVGTFDIVNTTTLDLGAFNLTASAVSLTIPAGITSITTTGTISITGGLSASAALTLTAGGTLTLGGALNMGSSDLTLEFANLMEGTTAPTLTAAEVTARHTGSSALTLPSWLFGAHGVALDIAEISIPTATTWTFLGLHFRSDTTIRGEALTLTSTSPLPFVSARADLTIDVASFSIGSDIALFGESISITSRAAGAAHAFNLNLSATNSLTVAGHLNGGTGALALTSTSGKIAFTTSPTITGSSITLTQVGAYDVSVPATFTPAPILAGPVGFVKPAAWGVCGTSCFDPATDIIVTDGDLMAAIAGKFTIASNDRLTLGSVNLISIGMPLVIPAGITSIVSDGMISITGGLTAEGELTIFVGTLELGGTFTTGTGGSGDLTLAGASGPVNITAAGDLTFTTRLLVDATVPSLGVPSAGSVGFNLTLNSFQSSYVSSSRSFILSGNNITLNGAVTTTTANSTEITAANDLFVNAAITAGAALALEATAGGITFTGTPTVTATTSIALTQTDEFFNVAPADFGSVVPSIVRTGSPQRSVFWATGGGETTAADITLSAGGNLADAIVGYFNLSGTTLNLGAFSLTVSGGTLTIPSTITTIITMTGTISITGGLTASAALTVNAPTLALGGTFTAGSNALTLTSANAITVSNALTISSALVMAAPSLGSTGSTLSLARVTSATALTLLGSAVLLQSGGVDVGANALMITATVGGLAFHSTSTLTASSITLTQVGEFPRVKPTNFSVVPAVVRTDGTIQRTLSWATGGTMIPANINLNHGGTVDINLGDEIVGFFEIDGNGVLDLSGFDFELVTNGKLILPSSLVEIRTTGTIQLGATNGIEGIGTSLTLTADRITFWGALDFGVAALSLDANTLRLERAGQRTIAAASIEFDVDNFENQKELTLAATTGSITLNSDLDAGANALVLMADAGAVVFIGNPMITGSSITLSQKDLYVDAVPAQFSVKPIASRAGLPANTVYAITTWASCPAGDSLCVAPVNISMVGATVDITLADVIAGKFAVVDGTLDLRGSSLELSTTANIILPAALTGITTSGNVTLAGASIITVGGSAIGGNLTITANTLTLGGIFAAGSNFLILKATGALSFDRDTTISGSNIELGGVTAPAASTANPALSVVASSALELSGFINVGTGSIALTAGSGAIIFNTGTDLTAASIALTQVDAYAATAPATFSVLPALIRTDSADANFNTPSWGVCGVDPQCFLSVDIDFTAAGDAALVDIIGSNFFIAGGVLDLGSSSLSINIGGTLTLPAGLIQIRTAGNNITLTVGTFSAPANMTIQTTGSGDITLQGSYVVASTFSLFSAGAVNFGTGAETSITSGSLSLFGNAAATASGQKLTLSGGFQVGSIDINVDELVLNTGIVGAAPTLTADDLTLNYTGTQAGIAVFASSHWAFAAGRNVTVRTTNSGLNMVLFAANATDSINLCAADGTCGSLTLESAGEIQLAGSTQTSASLGTISANNISLTATSIGSGSNVNRNLILNAAGDLTIDTPTFTLRNTHGAALTFNVAGSTNFVQDITVDAETMSGLGGTITAQALTLSSADSTTGSLAFSATRETTITTTGALTLEFETATAPASGQDLTLTATGGDITLGPLHIGSGTLEVTTDQNIAFTSTPDIIAAEIFLIWGGSTDFGTTAPATFTSDGSTTIIPFIGASSQTAGTWFQLASFSLDTGSADINFSSPLTLTRGTETLVVSVSAAGVLNFGDNIINLTTLGNIILPASIREIRATNLTINAATIGSGAQASPFASALSIIATDDLELNAAISMNSGVALNLSFGDDLEGTPSLTTTSLGVAYTGTASVSLPSWVFDATRELRLSIATIALTGNTTWSAASISFGTDTTITSTSNLALNVPTLDAGTNALTINVANLSFLGTSATNITGGAISLSSTTAPTPSGQDLTLEATGGDITLGSLSIGSGTLSITTDQNIVFTATPDIIAAEIFLTWAGSTDFGTTAPATFTSDGTTLITPFIEAANQTAATWFQLAGYSFDGGANDIDFSAPLTLNRGSETLVVSVSADGVLDFGDNIIRLTTTGNIILPASIREIRATNLAINAAGIGSAAADAPFANPLSIITTDDLELNTTIAMTAGTPLNISFGDDLEGVLTLTTTNLGLAYTGTSTAAITLPSWVFTNVVRELRLSVANITFSSDEIWRAASISFGTDTTITSTSNLVLNVLTLDAGTNALTIDVANLSFSQASASTITGSAISLTSTTAPTIGSGENLTITATTGNLTLEGAFNVSPGGMFLAAPQGIIAFIGAPRLTASAFSLTQGSVAFAVTKPATFVNAASANVAPTIRLTTGVQLPVDWDVQTFSELLPQTASGGYDLSALLSTGGMLDRFETNGVLDFGNTDLILGATDNISIPDRITEIRGRNIIISATMFGRGDATSTNPLNRELEFVATDNIVFMADVQSDSRITFTGRSITFNSAKATQISGSEILIETTRPGHANNQNVTLEATGNITLNANLNIGLGSVVVNAGGELITTDANTITAHTITYNASTIRNGASEVRLTAYDNIYLIGTSLNNRDAPVSLIAGGSIVTGGAFAITGSAVHFEQGQARYQAGRLTLHALTGGLTIVGPVARDMTTLIVSGHDQLDRSNAVIGGNVTVEISP